MLAIVSRYMVFHKSDAITGLVEFPYCNLDRMEVLIFIRMLQHFHCMINSHTPSIAPSYWTINAKTPDLGSMIPSDPLYFCMQKLLLVMEVGGYEQSSMYKNLDLDLSQIFKFYHE